MTAAPCVSCTIITYFFAIYDRKIASLRRLRRGSRRSRPRAFHEMTFRGLLNTSSYWYCHGRQRAEQ
eukprot:9462202-Pyramimonas_sp.AAC.1